MKLDVVNSEGKGLDPIDADDAVFGIEPNRFVIHQTLLAQLANRRAGTAKTKTRGEVAGSTAKIRRQKGIGRARLGAIRSPAIKGGGVAFGPRPRDFDQRLPKRMRRLAIRSVLSSKVADGSLRVLDALAFDQPRTKAMVSLLGALGLERSTLVVIAASDSGVKVSARNLKKVDVLSAPYLNVVDMLAHQNVLMTVGAVRQAERLWGGDRATRRRSALEPAAPPVQAAPPAARARRRPTAPVPVKPPEAPVAEKPAPRRRAAAPVVEKAVAEKPTRRRRAAAPVVEAPVAEKPARRRRATAPVEEAPVAEEPAPRLPAERRGRRRTPKSEEGASNA